MSWEERNGRQYYYRKRRDGDQVYSVYVGSDFIAEIASMQDKQRREERAAERQAWNKTKAEILAIDREVNQTIDTCRDLVNAGLVASGFHTHKGQWRRKRGR